MSASTRAARCAALIWVAVFVCLVLALALSFTPAKIRTDFRAMLPAGDVTQSSSAVFAGISDAAAQKLVVLVRAGDEKDTAAAARTVTGVLGKAGLTVDVNPARDARALVKALTPYRTGFIRDEDHAWLAAADDAALTQRALRELYRPVAVSPVAWADDPLGLFAGVLTEAAALRRFTEKDGFMLAADPDGKAPWVVLTVKTGALTTADGTPVTEALRQARAAAEKVSEGSEVLAFGPALIAEHAVGRASRESSLMGTVSAVALTLLILVFLRSVRAVFQILATLAVSFTAAFAVVWLTFGGIHVITLVFGMTLLGIAADYVFHYRAELLAEPDPKAARDKLARGLTVSLATSVAGYGAMLMVPMPSLREMALFCITGLVCAWLTVLLVLPLISKAGRMPAVAAGLSECLAGLARPGQKRWVKLTGLAVLLALAAGIPRLQTTDELRLLTALTPETAHELKRMESILPMPSVAQFFVVKGATSDETVTRALTLTKQLKALRVKGVISDFQTGLGILTPASVQAKNRALVSEADARALALTGKTLGALLKPQTPEAPDVLGVKAWLAMPLARELARFWLSDTETLVMLSGVTPAALPSLAATAERLGDGVSFVNTTGEISASLALWRETLSVVLVLSFALMAVILAVIYRARAVRMVLPVAFSVVTVLGVMGWAGLPLTLFTVMPLVLVLALGVDYAVMLYGNPGNRTGVFSVFLAAVSTILSFGLLAFSATPALHLFGVTLAVGISAVLVLTLVMRPEAAVSDFLVPRKLNKCRN